MSIKSLPVFAIGYFGGAIAMAALTETDLPLWADLLLSMAVYAVFRIASVVVYKIQSEEEK